MGSDEPSDRHGPGEVALDAITALGTALSRLDGRVTTLADRAADGPLLVIVVEHRSSACRQALTALAGTGTRMGVVSQGRPEAAGALVARTGLEEHDVLVEPAPHAVSDALAAREVPTFVLIEALEPVAWHDGWDPQLVAPLVARAGGRLAPQAAGDGPVTGPSRLLLDEDERRRAETGDAALATYGD